MLHDARLSRCSYDRPDVYTRACMDTMQTRHVGLIRGVHVLVFPGDALLLLAKSPLLESVLVPVLLPAGDVFEPFT